MSAAPAPASRAWNTDSAPKVAQALVGIDRTIAAGPYRADFTTMQGYPVPAWYADGKFGIFIHWGVYAVAAFGNEWYAHAMYRRDSKEFAHHLARAGSHVTQGYKDLIPGLTASAFDARAWTALFRQAGARFVVPVAEHHDGFCMYDSALTRWTATRMGPRRDILGELARASREAGLVFGCSSHRAEHCWFFGHGLEFASDVTAPETIDLYGPLQAPPTDLMSRTQAPPPPGFCEDWLARSCELVERYEPQLLWFDWWIQHEAWVPWLPRFAAFYYNWAHRRGLPVAINAKYNSFPENACVFDIERGQLQGIAPRLWQNDTSVARNSWGYTEAQDYKEPVDLIHDLIDIVAKNGALLLNIGPRADGTIPEREQDLLRAIGGWLARHGEAIYDTRPWVVFGEGPTAVPEGAFSDTKRARFTAEDVRFTVRGETLYAIVLGVPQDGRVVIRSAGLAAGHLRARPGAVELVGEGAVPWTQTAEALTVQLPPGLTGPAIALRIRGVA